MRILITGATGFLGRATVRELGGAGHTLRAIVRDAGGAAGAWPGATVEVVEGDPRDPAVVGTAAQGIDAVVHLAATFNYDRGSEGSMSANASVARTVLEAARAARVARVVDISSLVVFGLGTETVDETSPLITPGGPGWNDPYIRSKVEAELVGRECEAAGLPRITLHPGTVVGPDGGTIGPSAQLLLAILRGGTLPDTWSPWVDVRDVARAIALALTTDVGARFCLTSGVVTHRVAAALLDEATGVRRRRIFVSPAMIRRLARINDLAGGRLANLPDAGRLDFVLTSARSVDATRSRHELRLTYRPAEETFADTIRWWASHGVIDAGLAGRLGTAAPAEGAA